jgi:UDP-N-acetylmuramate: L-alanyl-gamma-D-glutamyl-meso-diaminopimelate ligase
VGPARILAVFEPRSNTMKLGTMKAQLPWSLEQADLAFCHSGGLGWDAVEAMAPMGERARVAGTIDEVLAQVVAAAQTGRPCAVHEQWWLWRHPRQAVEGP